MMYKRETGAILGQNKTLLHVVEGTPGNVDFPLEVIRRIHRASPGGVYALSHVHPPQMKGLSTTDKGLLESLAYELYPFPARLMTITEMHSMINNELYVSETCYIGLVESKESWVARGKNTPRRFEILKEFEFQTYYNKWDDRSGWYGRLLLDKSYEENAKMESTGRFESTGSEFTKSGKSKSRRGKQLSRSARN